MPARLPPTAWLARVRAANEPSPRDLGWGRQSLRAASSGGPGQQLWRLGAHSLWLELFRLPRGGEKWSICPLLLYQGCLPCCLGLRGPQQGTAERPSD